MLLFVVGCVVVGGEYLSEVFVWWGILRALPPRRGGGWGRRGWWDGMVMGAGAAALTLPSIVGVPLSRSLGAPH